VSSEATFKTSGKASCVKGMIKRRINIVDGHTVRKGFKDWGNR
jgi:hypothetical protein